MSITIKGSTLRWLMSLENTEKRGAWIEGCCLAYERQIRGEDLAQFPLFYPKREVAGRMRSAKLGKELGGKKSAKVSVETDIINNISSPDFVVGSLFCDSFPYIFI